MKNSRSLPLVDDPHGLRLPCISCGGQLPDPPWSITLLTDADAPVLVEDVAECPTCGVRYAGDLLRRAHPEQWAFVMLNGFVCRACDHHAPIIWTDDDGHPIPCPTHGAHPAVSQ